MRIVDTLVAAGEAGVSSRGARIVAVVVSGRLDDRGRCRGRFRAIGFPDMTSVARDRIRLAELVALLSLGTDLGLGQPMEHMIRACLIALRLGERLDG